MAKDPRYSIEAINAKADAHVDLLDGGYLRIYSGTRPIFPDDAVTSVDPAATLLAELQFGTPAFGAAVSGVAEANALAQVGTNHATGTGTWFRLLKSDGTSPVADGTVGAGGTFDLVLLTDAFVIAGATTVTSFTYTEPGGAL